MHISVPRSPAEMARAEAFVREAYGIYGSARSDDVLPDGSTTYVVKRGERILGVTAILSGGEGLQIDRYYDEKIENHFPPGVARESIIEIGKTAATRGSGAVYLFFTTLMDLVQEHAERSQATHWMAMMKQPLVEMFQKHGWPLEVLPVSPAPVESGDPIHAYLSDPPPVLLVLSSVAESIGFANKLRRK